MVSSQLSLLWQPACFPVGWNCPHSHLQTEAHSSVTKGRGGGAKRALKRKGESFHFSKRETVFGEESDLHISSFSFIKGCGWNFPPILSFFFLPQALTAALSVCHSGVSLQSVQVKLRNVSSGCQVFLTGFPKT